MASGVTEAILAPAEEFTGLLSLALILGPGAECPVPTTETNQQEAPGPADDKGPREELGPGGVGGEGLWTHYIPSFGARSGSAWPCTPYCRQRRPYQAQF